MSLDFLKTLTKDVAGTQQPKVLGKSAESSESVESVESSESRPVQVQRKKFVHGNNVIIKNGTYKGYYGNVREREFQPAKYEIRLENADTTSKSAETITILASYVQPLSKPAVNTKVLIKRGTFKGKVGVIVKIHAARISIFIDAIGRTVSEHFVKTSSGRFVSRSITPADVFYIDLLLKNGNLFQVNEILPDNLILGMERVSGEYKQRTISKADIASEQPGFRFITGESTESAESAPLTQGGPIYVSESEPDYLSESELQEVTDETDQDVDNEITDYDNDGIEGDKFEEITDTIDYSEDSPLKATFKDIERTSYVKRILSSQEEAVRVRVIKLLKMYGISDGDIDVYDVIDNVMTCYKNIQSRLEKSPLKDKWNITDLKYIISVLVLSQIIKGGMMYVFGTDNPVDNFVNTMIKNKFFTTNDIRDSIFVSGQWTDVFQVNAEQVKKLRSDKEYARLFRMMFDNCTSVLRTILPIAEFRTDSSAALYLQDLIPLKRIDKETLPKSYISIGELGKIQEREPALPSVPVIPANVKKIVWGPPFERGLANIKQRLSNTIRASESHTNPTVARNNKTVYGYVLQNIENAPFEILRMRKVLQNSPHTKLDETKLDKLISTWDSLFRWVLNEMSTLKTTRETKVSELQKRQQEQQQKRQVALLNMGKLNITEGDTDETDADVQSLQRSLKRTKLRQSPAFSKISRNK